MKILVIANNFGDKADGIGYYSKRMSYALSKYCNVEFDVSSGYTIGLSKFRRIFSLKMCKAIDEAIKKVKQTKYDTILIEYPFVEENPLFLLKLRKLNKFSKKNKIKIVLSLHEYSRVHKLKKFLIRKMCKFVDRILITNEEDKKILSDFCDDIILRSIPSGIDNLFSNCIKKDYNKYIYFGLVNSSKAFDEMISAWKKFNYKKEYTLEILTATKLAELEDDSISIYMNLEDSEICKHLDTSGFSILPIKPEINLNNSSFIASAQAGCICLGHFNEKISNLNFLIEFEDYSVEGIIEGLKKSRNLLIDDSMVNSAKEFGEKFTIDSISKEIEKMLH